MKRFLWLWLPPLAWMSLIFILSAQPDLPHPPQHWLDMLIKKGGHAFVFGVQAWLYLRALRRHFSSPAKLRWVCAGLAVLYAASDEFHQTFVPGRNGRLSDVFVDSLGVGGAMALDWWLARQPRRPR